MLSLLAPSSPQHRTAEINICQHHTAEINIFQHCTAEIDSCQHCTAEEKITGGEVKVFIMGVHFHD